MASSACWTALLVTLMALLHAADVQAECGYKACPTTRSNKINVHLVPHTHDDVGWLKTVDQYYYGSRNGIQRAGVQYILDNVVQELLKNSKRRFIFVESAFFFKWYDEQTTDMQEAVKKLVNEGRLEFAGGAWSMNDEAAVHYQSVIDQFSIGLKRLSETFGECSRPRIGWQIDPFGHSREMASIFAQMGYDGQFFARMDYIEKNTRMKNLTAEMIWHGSEELGESAELFTGMLYNHYSAPPGFCFDTLCNDEPIIDGDSFDNNVEKRVDHFVEYIHNLTKHYRTSHLLVPMGDDFNYENANMNFKNMDKLIKHVNERSSNVTVFYSTPACYLNALHELPVTWPNKTQDFFPYSTDWHTYWTGYYSSRPTQKRFERDGNHFLQVAKQLTSLANLTGVAVDSNLNKLRHAMGVMQHHDAITGTERQRVASDYNRMLTAAMVSAQSNARMALQKLSNLTDGEFESCLLLNISVCEFVAEDANNVVVTLFNPLAQPSRQYVRVPVENESFTVTDAAGRVIQSDVMPVSKEVISMKHRPNYTQHELVFPAYVEKLAHFYITNDPNPRKVVDEIKYRTAQLQKRVPARFQRAASASSPEESLAEIETSVNTVVRNSEVKLTFDSTGHLTQVSMNGITENVRQDFYYYRGAYGNNAEFKNRSSGAYIFRPNGTELLIGANVELKVYEGANVKEVHQRFNDWVSQVIRIYEGVVRVEFEWLVGPIPINDGQGKEVITRLTTNLQTKGVFFTDSNGREMLRRVRNHREYFTANLTEPISGNYYPVTARLAMESDYTRIALLNDRAQGGTSLQDGQLDLMLHRRLLRDDGFGVGEALNETSHGQGLIARGKVYLIMSSKPQRLSLNERLAQQEIHLPFWKFFSNALRATNTVPPQIADFSSLPINVQVLTLEPYTTNERLLRLENFMDRNETQTATFNIRQIFDQLGGEEIRETTLDGNVKLSDMKRFKFQQDGSKVTKVEYYTSKHAPLSATKEDAQTKFIVTLDPMQIRTFIIKWK